MKTAIITKIISNRYTVTFDQESHIAVAMGKLRLGMRPVVGDRVEIEFLENKWVIQKVKERKNQLKRPLVANVDQALIVMSAKKPDFSYRLVDRLIFLISIEQIEPVIVISKCDLENQATLDAYVHEYASAGYQVLTTQTHDQGEGLKNALKDKISVLAGQSGVGKSSILNRLNPDFRLNTQEISKALGRGKHTTRHNQLYEVAKGWVVDTPGFSSLDFAGIDPLVLSRSIKDFQGFDEQCRYRDCLHISEPDCHVKAMIATRRISPIRYQHYQECLHLIKEDNHQ